MSNNNNNLIDDTKGKISVVNDGVGMFERLINIFKTNSLWICVMTHALINVLSQTTTGGNQYISYVCKIMIVVMAVVLSGRKTRMRF